jgi:LAS superfamily LD-carboxypeptidase LdcB
MTFQKKGAESPGWNKQLADQLFWIVDRTYAPRGFNPHATGFVFDLDFWIVNDKGQEGPLGISTARNRFALQSAAGMWLNKYAMNFGFDSYDTSMEVFYLEYRNWKAGSQGATS